jgi:hypothetical protein
MISYKKGFKYQLHEDYRIQTSIHPSEPIETTYIRLATSGELTIKKGYAWDGASGLTIDSKSSMRGALVHDALYQLLRMKLLSQAYRSYADALLRDICVEDGMWKWRANTWYRAVRKFADFAADPKNKKQVLTAP